MGIVIIHPSIHPPTALHSLTFRPSLPLPDWMASIRLLCRHVSFSMDLYTTGLNFWTGPKTEEDRAPGVKPPPSVTVTEASCLASVVTRTAFTLSLLF